MIRVELYEIARRLAGVPVVEVDCATLGDALAALSARHPALEGPVIRGRSLAPLWRASVDGETFVVDPSTPLPDGTRVVLVSALAGG